MACVIIMEPRKNYHDEQNKLNTVRMRNVLEELPRFVNNFSGELKIILPHGQGWHMRMI